MALFDLFSRRKRIAAGDVPDVYQYEELPMALRTQIIHIWREAVCDTPGIDNQIFSMVLSVLRKEWGVFRLEGGQEYDSPREEIERTFISRTVDIDRLLDIVELVFFAFDNHLYSVRVQNSFYTSRGPSASECIAELNARFKQHGVGYQFEAGQILRVDSQIIHANAVKPLLSILGDADCAGVNEEFLRAHEHYRHQRYKECLNECLKAFESGMKVICHRRKWSFPANATAKNLIDAIFTNGLVPSSMQSEFASLRSLLKAGVPTIRNKNSGHGQGSRPSRVPESLALFGLNLTASTILYLFQTEKSDR